MDEALQLFEYDDSASLDIQLVREFPVENLMVQDITYASPMGGRVPGFLFLPGGEGPFPGLILMHGLPSNRHDLTGHAERYTRTGTVIPIITAPWARTEASPRDFPIQFTPQDSVEQVQRTYDHSVVRFRSWASSGSVRISGRVAGKVDRYRCELVRVVNKAFRNLSA